jgi:hypothetical protein
MKHLIASFIAVSLIVLAATIALVVAAGGTRTTNAGEASLAVRSANSEVQHKLDPENAEVDFKRLYEAIDAYRHAHNRLPTHKELMDTSRPLVEGFHLTDEDMNNPDEPYLLKENNKELSFDYVIQLELPRPDGTSKPAFPADGERDVWLYTLAYTTETKVEEPGSKRKIHSAA